MYDFLILAPRYPGALSLTDLEAFNVDFHGGLAEAPEWVREHFTDPERASRLVVFAKNSGVVYACWDPEDVRDPVNAEYGTYLLLPDIDSPVYAAASFAEFVMECCYGLRFRQIVGDTNEELPPLVFEPESEP